MTIPEAGEAETRLLGVVLCGGRSSRMGRDKAGLAHPAGGTFLEHALDRLRAVCHDVCISGSSKRADESRLQVVRIPDPVAHEGPIVGVAASLRYAAQHGYAACFFTPVDMPDVTARELVPIRDRWQLDSKQLFCVRDAGTGQIDPLVGIYPVQLADRLSKAASSQDRSLRRFVQSQDPTLIGLPTQILRNVNRPEDL
jgi:molybdopterin-guanine dinucleotide biosynthesis protein A